MGSRGERAVMAVDHMLDCYDAHLLPDMPRTDPKNSPSSANSLLNSMLLHRPPSCSLPPLPPFPLQLSSPIANVTRHES